MKNYFANGCLGVTPRGGCIVTAVCMIMVSIMHIVFESGHLRELRLRINATNNNTSNKTKMDVERNMGYFSYVTYLLLGLSIIMCFVLLVSVFKNIYRGILGYIAWNFLFELARIIIMGLSYFEMQKVSLGISDLQWVGLGFRLPLQAFFMVYVVTYLLELMESRGRPLIRRRRAPKKRKAKYPKTPPALKFAVKEET